MKILAIETSCDETAIALIEAKGGLNPSAGSEPRFRILKNLVASQIKIHRPFGGIVPSLAKREHLKNLPILYKKLLFGGYLLKPDIIAVTVGPGLEPALWTGINFAKNLHKELKAKIIGVNHLEGHLYSFSLNSKSYKLKAKSLFPAIALLVSGGHTILLKMDSLTKFKKLGETRDDAVGEAFDKVARLLELPYPGGPEIEKLALSSSNGEKPIPFPRPMINQKNYDFSFSGLKTAVLYYLRNMTDANLRMSRTQRIVHSHSSHNSLVRISQANIAASFQKAAFDVLISKTLAAAKEFKAESIMISGGVAANKILQKEFKKAITRLPNYSITKLPQLLITKYPTDNAAMIAAAAYINHLRKKKHKLVAQGNLSI